LNRKKQREQSFSLFPFAPVRKIFIGVNSCHVLRGERQSAGNSGFGCGWPRWVKLFCDVEFWLERLTKLIGLCENNAIVIPNSGLDLC